MPPYSDSEEDDEPRFLLPQGVGETEDVEGYRIGGFHPVHLGEKYDDGRYRIVHKLGAGGFSTVWLARDESEEKWVALKIVDADHSVTTETKSTQIQVVLADNQTHFVVGQYRQFLFDGPNGRHLSLVLPVFGPSTSELSYAFSCRLTPRFARKLAYQATKAVAELHSCGLCHGDVTTGNLLLAIADLECYSEEEIYRLFGQPVTGALETESGETPGPEAPRYIVKSINFLSSPENIIKPEIKLIDFDQCFPISSPPQKMLGTPLSFLAPEVAVGQGASPASDVWALGCCILRLRSGEDPFSNPFEVNSPLDLISFIVHTLGGTVPPEWQEGILWDSQGYPTRDTNKGEPYDLEWYGLVRSLRGVVYNTWDEPKDRIVQTGISRPEDGWRESDHQPFPSRFSDMAWNPKAVKVDNAYLFGYGGDWDELQKVLPKISGEEAALLLDLLTKIFVYEPADRLTAEQILNHPWFQFDAQDQTT
ncbi:CMGC SRPK kinase [Fusarium heterosporum]|uniref:EKC/KEOPS complex subunit BUD32 n=1 Tax=Fusarium heterosporum TaxID=42747 RepID=A0A8H5THZ3_FUSHE|nr:CMGC SRPK kinase [Fusarium heterosporum]